MNWKRAGRYHFESDSGYRIACCRIDATRWRYGLFRPGQHFVAISYHAKPEKAREAADLDSANGGATLGTTVI